MVLLIAPMHSHSQWYLFMSMTTVASYALLLLCPLHISRLASDVVGGKSGQNLPTSRLDPIHIGRMARNACIRAGWYGERTVKESYLLQLPLEDSCIVHVRLPISRLRRAISNMFNIACLILANDLPMVSRWGPDSRFRVGNPLTLAEPTASGHNRGVGSANVKRALQTSPHAHTHTHAYIWTFHKIKTNQISKSAQHGF